MNTRSRSVARSELPISRRASSTPRAASSRGALAGDAWRLLMKASAVLDRSIRYEETLSSAVRLAVPRIADYAALALPADDGSLTWAAATHCNPDKVPLVGRMPGHGTQSESVVATARGRPRLIRNLDRETLYGLVADDTHRDMLAALELTSLIVLPLSVAGRDLGSLVLGTTRESARMFTERDVVIAGGFGRRVAAAVHRALLLRDAENAARARERIVGLVSHDLRNPLSTIMLAVDFLLDEVLTDDSAHRNEREHIETIRRAARRMDRLVGDLLDVTAIEAGGLRLEPTTLPAQVIVSDAVDLLSPLAAERKITVVADVGTPLPALAADRERLLQVFSNLGGNAIKFTPEGGQVVIAARAGERCVEFVVRDTGPGIAAGDLPCIFLPFWQQRATRRAGVGLGLAICRAIVEAHGGAIGATSELGVGTTFTFTIPTSDGRDRSAAAGA